jgi:predicted MFS family arabinose efflux permease
LLPGVLAALLQNRLPPLAVGIAGPLLQAALALSITNATAFPLYAVPAGLYVTLVIFTHTFLFGLLSKVDSSGRAVAATPAMMMTGSAIGPVLGGAIVAGIGFEGLGYAVSVFAVVAAGLMMVARNSLTARPATAPEPARG